MFKMVITKNNLINMKNVLTIIIAVASLLTGAKAHAQNGRFEIVVVCTGAKKPAHHA